MGLGYLAATGIFALLLLALVATQVTARRFHPALYWATIIASTTTGTTLADFSTRSLRIGYIGGSLMLISFVLASLAAWRATLGRIAADDIRDRRAELFYWLTITFSQTLGTALGDWLADTGGLGYVGAAVVFAAGLAVLALLYFRTTRVRALLDSDGSALRGCAEPIQPSHQSSIRRTGSIPSKPTDCCRTKS